MPSPSIKEWNRPLALASDASQCGEILRQVPSRILTEAASLKDPWDYLLSFKKLPKDVHGFCRAAKSAEYAAYRLARMARGIASARTDWAEEYKAALHEGNARRIRQLERKLLLRTEGVFPGQLLAKAPVGLQSVVRSKIAAVNKRLARRLGGKKARVMLHEGATTAALAASARDNLPREWLLVTGWLRLPHGDPALCCFSKRALGQLFHHLGFALHKDADAKEDIRNRLRRLGLVQGPTIVGRVEKRHDGAILLTLRDGTQHVLKTPVKAGGGLRYKGWLQSGAKPKVPPV